jgi:hypothetical protein
MHVAWCPEQSSPYRLFDSDWNLEQNPDVKEVDLQYGAAKGRDPLIGFVTTSRPAKALIDAS